MSAAPQRVAEAETRKIIEEMGEYKHRGILRVYAHSQGAETVHNLSPGLKRMMDIDASPPPASCKVKIFITQKN